MKTDRSVCILSGFIFVALTLCVTAPDVYAQDNNIGQTVLNAFTSRTGDWWGKLQVEAFKLFKLVVTIEVALFGIRMILQQSQLHEILGQFVNLLLYSGFIALVLNNYQSWATTIALDGLKPLVGSLSGNEVDPGTPIAIVMALGEKIIALISEIGVFGAIVMPLYLILTFIILIVIFVLISALYIITVCEFHIIANIGVLLIGLGGSKIFKDYAVNMMRYILSVALKLFVLQIIMNIGFQIITVESVKGANFDAKAFEIVMMLVQSILLLALAKSLPETCAGILSGATINSGNPLMSAARSAITMASTGAGFAVGAAKTGASAVGAVKDSYDVAKDRAKASGASGVMSMAKGMGGAFLEARGAAKTAQLQSSQGSMVSQLKSLGNMARASKPPLPGEGAADAATAPMSAAPAPETVGGGTGSTSSGPDSSFPAGTPVPPSPLQPLGAAAPASSGPATPAAPAMNLPPSPKDMAAMKPKGKPVDMRTPKVGD